MAIELICKGCSRKLRIADENAGKLARCPSCGETFTVPAASAAAPFSGMTTLAPASSPLPSASSDRWYLKASDGNTYGPVAKGELDSWVTEGRVTADSQIMREGDTTWQAARQQYPQLGMAARPSFTAPTTPAGGNPFADKAPGPYQNPYASPQPVPQTPRPGGFGGVYVQPHRGGIILTLGILGLCLCGFLGIAAVVMASQDLKLMNEGRMDVSGKGMTIAGMVLGIIAIVFIALGILINVAGVAGGLR